MFMKGFRLFIKISSDSDMPIIVYTNEYKMSKSMNSEFSISN